MIPGASQRPVTSAALDDELDVSLCLTCPMCHMPMPLAQGAMDAGTGWPCSRCGQRWDAARLSTVAAYAAWVVERFAIGATRGEPLPAVSGSVGWPATQMR